MPRKYPGKPRKEIHGFSTFHSLAEWLKFPVTWNRRKDTPDSSPGMTDIGWPIIDHTATNRALSKYGKRWAAAVCITVAVMWPRGLSVMSCHGPKTGSNLSHCWHAWTQALIPTINQDIVDLTPQTLLYFGPMTTWQNDRNLPCFTS